MKPYVQESDHELMACMGQGDQQAFAEIYNRYHGVLFVHACRMLGSSEDAKDIVHDVFTRLWSGRGELSITGSVASYLYTAVRNRILDRMTKEKHHQRYVDSLAKFLEGGVCITDHAVRERELSKLIEREVARLPEKMRKIFLLSRRNHLSHQEIASEMQISDKTVKKQISNALLILRKKIEVAIMLTITILFS